MNKVPTIIEMFEATVGKYGDKCAICSGDEQITYSGLKSFAMSIATGILKRTDSTGKSATVAIAMNKSPKCLAVMLGIMYSGNPYTVLDIKSPIERIEKILDTLDSNIIIADSKGAKALGKSKDIKAEILDVDELIGVESDHERIEQIKRNIVDTDPAYILFTSGSTGVPKGTVVGHSSVVAYSRAVASTFSLDQETVFGSQTPFYFSMSVLDIFVTLYLGATLVIIPKMLFSFPIRLFDYMKEQCVNTIYWVPTAMELVADRGLFNSYDATFLKNVLFAGEPLPSKYLNIWKDALPKALFANLYGPTEVTDTCTYYICQEKMDISKSIPIGCHFDNCDVFLLDESNRKIEPGSEGMGEICVRGPFLAYGYYNNPEQTAKAFVQNPVNPHYPEMIYRTGDLGMWMDDENLIYAGRKDNQIKHLGYRIELGEIENVVAAIEQMDIAVAIYEESVDEIVLCYNGSADEQDVLAEANKLLPSYMRPSRVVRFDAFQINSNGKIDRKKMKETIKKAE